MNIRLRNIVTSGLAAALTAVLLTACSSIDDDLSGCDNSFELNYELRLVTNMTTELRTQLGLDTDVQLATSLRTQLSNIFTDYAHDVDLSFYDTQGDSVRLHHDQHIMNAAQASYALSLPMHHYMHLAVANVQNNGQVTLVNDEHCHPSVLHQEVNDTIDSHSTGLFTARLPMEVQENVNQEFSVHLYMANCAAVLVLDPRGWAADDVKVYAKGLATDFNICDSSYVFVDTNPVIRTTRLDGGNEVGFCAVTFPSRDPYYNSAASRSVIETTDPFVAQPGDEELWQLRAYVKKADGTTTETVLGLREPLRAGQLKIIKGWIGSDGDVRTEDQTVAVSVTLDWQDGQHHEDVEL